MSCRVGGTFSTIETVFSRKGSDMFGAQKYVRTRTKGYAYP